MHGIFLEGYSMSIKGKYASSLTICSAVRFGIDNFISFWLSAAVIKRELEWGFLDLFIVL